mgnify:CR=1 FL=1
MYDEIARMSLLYDFYSQLLSCRQRDVIRLYHGENLSLSEIAQEFGISRQAVHDTLKKGEKALDAYEEKLGLVERFLRSSKALRQIENDIDKLISENSSDSQLACRLSDIKKVIEDIDEQGEENGI